MSILANLFKLSHNSLSIIFGIFGIGFLIGIHEFGHFLFCKLFKINTPTFSIGFGPKLLKKKFGNTLFTLSAIPLGGYVEIEGQDNTTKTQGSHSFSVKPLYQKLSVIFGGILFNLLFSYIIFTLIFLLGTPKTPLLYPQNAVPVISTIEKDSPASKYQYWCRCCFRIGKCILEGI